MINYLINQKLMFPPKKPLSTLHRQFLHCEDFLLFSVSSLGFGLLFRYFIKTKQLIKKIIEINRLIAH